MCWAPFHAQRLIAVYVDPGDTPEEEERFATMFNIVTYISGVLYFMSTMINPILYHSMSNKFKEAFWDTIYRDFHGFNCITIPEHWKKKQESRYNTRRGQQDWRSRNGASGEQQASGRKRRQSSSMFELQPLGSTAANTTTTTSAIVSADAQSSLSARMGRSAVVDVNKLHTELYLNGGRSASGLPPLLRSQSMYSTPVVQRALWGAAGGARGPPPRRSRTVEVLDDTVRMQLSTKGMLLGRSEDGDDAAALTAATTLTAAPTARVAGMLTLELPVNRDLPQGKRAAKDALLDASALDAIVPYPATPSPPGSAPPSPAYVPLHSRSASPASPATTPVYVVRGGPPDSPPYLPPRVVELYRKNEAVPEPGWV
ncbi:uncharacterized protein LOC127752056 [Frankliniella occidentalis]|uniref:Uncharacterized protein LOC127752056 n=1 Tax=Frankliniella occidentalis TaxID=133901 RepID=A0A9C6XBH7_FRAOC|nr:uncharacterized protein LOC127752056 [Frankliniella occidentalis]